MKLIVEIIEPFHGRILDSACGSGGMFVHSAEFVERHDKTVNDEISIYGVEKDRVRAIPWPVLHPPVLPVRANRTASLTEVGGGTPHPPGLVCNHRH